MSASVYILLQYQSIAKTTFRTIEQIKINNVRYQFILIQIDLIRLLSFQVKSKYQVIMRCQYRNGSRECYQLFEMFIISAKCISTKPTEFINDKVKKIEELIVLYIHQH